MTFWSKEVKLCGTIFCLLKLSTCYVRKLETNPKLYFIFYFSSISRKCSILSYLSKFYIRKNHSEFLFHKIKNKGLTFIFLFTQNEAFLQSYLLSLPNGLKRGKGKENAYQIIEYRNKKKRGKCISVYKNYSTACRCLKNMKKDT